MPKPTTKSRQELRSRFVRNAIPTETDFADLIAGSLNQADDGVLKLPDQPLGLVRQKPDQPVLRFFADPTAEGSAWQVQLASGDKPGFGLAAADGKLALFVDGATGNVRIGATASTAVTVAGNLRLEEGLLINLGKEIYFSDNGQIRSLDDTHRILFRRDENKMEFREFGDIVFSSGSTGGQETSKMVINKSGNVGIGIATPGAKLTVSGANNASKDPESGIAAGGQLAIKGDAPQIDFIDINHNDWSIHVNNSKMYFIRQPWEFTDLVLDGGGKVGIGTAEPEAKLQIVHTNQEPNGGSLILGPTSQSNLRLGYNQGYSWIQSHGSTPLAINSIGNNVGIGTTKPEFKLDVNGTVRLGGFTTEEKEEWPNIVWCRDLDKGWDEGLIKHGKSYGFFGRAGFGVHIHESRSFELFSTGWRPLLGVEGGTGNTSIRGNVKVNGCITPSAGNSESTGLLFPKDPGGGGGDAAWLRYYPYNGESCVLEIGITNDPDDYIYLKSTGGVKIDVLKLGDKWRLSGVGDHEANDDWLRMKNIANTAYYGGLAASKFWTVQGQYNQSDLRSKDNIKNLSSPLENLLNLQGVSFTWKESLEALEGNGTESLGLIAQDVEKVFPQLVQNGPDGKLGVNYIGLIPVLVECIKEQQIQIHSLRDQLIDHL